MHSFWSTTLSAVSSLGSVMVECSSSISLAMEAGDIIWLLEVSWKLRAVSGDAIGVNGAFAVERRNGMNFFLGGLLSQ